MIKINADRKMVENLPPQVFTTLGINQIAYVKPVDMGEGARHYVVHAADGTEVSVFDKHWEAEDFIRQSNLLPVTLH